MTENDYKPMGTAEFAATCRAIGLDASWVSQHFKVDSVAVLGWFDGYGVIPSKIGKEVRRIADESKELENGLIKQVRNDDAQSLIINRKSNGEYPNTFYQVMAYRVSRATGAEIVWKGDGR